GGVDEFLPRYSVAGIDNDFIVLKLSENGTHLTFQVKSVINDHFRMAQQKNISMRGFIKMWIYTRAHQAANRDFPFRQVKDDIFQHSGSTDNLRPFRSRITGGKNKKIQI